ncbi:MAG: TonB-dependent receptor plug domain-containing protein [Alloprevotella sp.]
MRIILILLCLWCSCRMCAQENLEIQRCLEAEEYYKTGQFAKAESMLATGIDTLSERARVEALRVMTLCCIAQDRAKEAERYASLLLNASPYFTAGLSDPPRFADLIEQIKTGRVNTIITASQQAESVEEAPMPVTLITQEMIQASGARNIKEVLLAFVPGMTEVASNEEYNIAMRGIYSASQDKILFMLNGHRLNSYSTNTAVPDYSIALDKIKQIEVVRGPASSLYGGAALTAAVNIITKDGRDTDGLHLAAGAGNYGQVTASAQLGQRFIEGDLFAWASYYEATGQDVGIPSEQQKGHYPVPGTITLGGFNKKPTYECGLQISLKRFSFLYDTSYSKYVAPYSMNSFFAPYSYGKYRTFNGAGPGYGKLSNHFEASWLMGKDDFTVRATVSYETEEQFRYQIANDTIPYYFGMTATPPGTHDTITVTKGVYQYLKWQEHTLGASLHANYNYRLTALGRGSISFRAEASRFRMNDAYYVEGDQFTRVLATFDDSKNVLTGSETSANAYLQFKHRFNDLFLLNCGMRYDYKKRSSGKEINELSPRMAVVFLQPKWSLKLSYSRSYVDAPYFYRNNTLDNFLAWEDMRSEYLNTIQLTFMGNRLLPHWNFEANFYYNVAENLITQNIFAFTNSDQMQNLGTEVQAFYQSRRFNSWLTLSWQHLVKTRDFNVFAANYPSYNVPELSAHWVASYRLSRHFSLNTHLQSLSAQKSLYAYYYYDEQGTINVAKKELDVPARVVWDAGAQFDYKRFGLELQVHNLLNKKYDQGGTSYAPLRQEGLWFTAKAKYKF